MPGRHSGGWQLCMIFKFKERENGDLCSAFDGAEVPCACALDLLGVAHKQGYAHKQGNRGG